LAETFHIGRPTARLGAEVAARDDRFAPMSRPIHPALRHLPSRGQMPAVKKLL
jgi:hypothetical protein